MQFGKLNGLALAVLGIILLSIQVMLYMTPRKVVTGPDESSIPKGEHAINPVTGILGVTALIAGSAIFVTRRRIDEPEAKHAIK